MNQSDQEEEKTLTPEQIKARKAEMMAFFEEQIPFLKSQREYETYVTEIDELRTRRLRAQVLIGQMLAPQEEKEPGEKVPVNVPKSPTVDVVPQGPVTTS